MQFTTLALSALALATAACAAPLEQRSSSGSGTYFYQGGKPGACGDYHSDNDMIAAINSDQFSGGSKCGKSIWIQHGSKTIKAKVADECSTCSWGSLDLSVGAFKSLSSLKAGLIPITWGMN